MHRHNLTWIAILGLIVLMFLRLPQMAARQDAVLNTYSALVEVDALAKQKYVEPIEDRRLVDGAIRGMLLTLDPYSGYIAPEELPAFERRAAGDYIGIGIEVGMKGGRLTVIAPIEGTPAAKAGVRAGVADPAGHRKTCRRVHPRSIADFTYNPNMPKLRSRDNP